MNKFYSFIIIVLVLFITGCGETADSNEQSSTDKQLKETTGFTESELETQVAAAKISKKYSIKSGIITFERKGVIGNQKVIVYFDDYGTKERNETYDENSTLIEVTMSDGENMYKMRNPNSEEKIAYVMGPGKFGTEMKFEPDPFKNSEKRRTKYQFKKLENMNILGKDCELYSMTTGGNVTTFGGWNSLHLYSKVDMSIGITETIAVDLKENVSVDPNLFKVPEGYITQK